MSKNSNRAKSSAKLLPPGRKAHASPEAAEAARISELRALVTRLAEHAMSVETASRTPALSLRLLLALEPGAMALRNSSVFHLMNSLLHSVVLDAGEEWNAYQRGGSRLEVIKTDLIGVRNVKITLRLAMDIAAIVEREGCAAMRAAADATVAPS